MAAAIITIVGILFFISILALIAPKTYDVSRSIVIHKPTIAVWEYLKSLEKQGEWSPWVKKDPNMFKEIRGVDGKVGAISYWRGNKEVGEGEQEIIRIIEGERMDQKLRFFKPFQSQSDCYITLKETSENNSQVAWGFRGESSFPMNIMLLFKSMDNMMGKDFEQGLQSLKAMAEK